MKITLQQNRYFSAAYWKELLQQLVPTVRREFTTFRSSGAAPGVFRTMVMKEMSDHIHSWRVVILMGIILLTCVGSLYTALSGIADAVETRGSEEEFFFLKLFTLSDGSLPPYFVFIGFLGPLLGISLGFDAINSEQNRGTLSRLLAQPIPRDYVINAKFTAALLVITMLFSCSAFWLSAPV